MSNLCADIAKDLVENQKAYMNGHVNSEVMPIGHWVEEFKKCKDYPEPSEPVVMEYTLNIPINIGEYTIISDKLKGKKWRAVFTEIISED